MSRVGGETGPKMLLDVEHPKRTGLKSLDGRSGRKGSGGKEGPRCDEVKMLILSALTNGRARASFFIRGHPFITFAKFSGF